MYKPNKGNFLNEIITENIRKLARQVDSRKRCFSMATKLFTDTKKLFAGGAIGYLCI